MDERSLYQINRRSQQLAKVPQCLSDSRRLPTRADLPQPTPPIDSIYQDVDGPSLCSARRSTSFHDRLLVSVGSLVEIVENGHEVSPGSLRRDAVHLREDMPVHHSEQLLSNLRAFGSCHRLLKANECHDRQKRECKTQSVQPHASDDGPELYLLKLPDSPHVDLRPWSETSPLLRRLLLQGLPGNHDLKETHRAPQNLAQHALCCHLTRIALISNQRRQLTKRGIRSSGGRF
jgi:hypothetical protein